MAPKGKKKQRWYRSALGLSNRSLDNLSTAETAVVWVCVMASVVTWRENGNDAIVSGPLVLLICLITILRAILVRRNLTSQFQRRQALGVELVSLSFALVVFFVFMDALDINPALNVNLGAGPLGIAIPLFVLVAIGYWAYGAVLGIPLAAQKGLKSIEWTVLFFVSIIAGLIINSALGNTGGGLLLALSFGTLCLYKGVKDLK
jgi:hypothetical protein